MMVRSWPFRGLLRGVWPCWLLAADPGPCRVQELPDRAGLRPADGKASATTGAGDTQKEPPPDDAADGLWMNSDRAKQISHNLDQIPTEMESICRNARVLRGGAPLRFGRCWGW